MSTEDLSAIIAQGADDLGIDIHPRSSVMFEKYFGFLEEQGEIVNLTAITGVQDVARFHFLDSLAVLNSAIFPDSRVIDVGSGAGFPGMPLKIAEPAIDLTLLDASGKRITFLSELCSLLGLEVAFIHERAETASKILEIRESFDIALSRAVAPLNLLCELCLPFVRLGGLFIAMKSITSEDEIAEAGTAIKTLGAALLETSDYTIPGTEVKHRIISLLKVSPTPEKYPRRFARIQNTPL